MASGLTPWLALELPEDPSKITPEMLAEWSKKQTRSSDGNRLQHSV
jgi:hypothetical protein